MTPFTLNTSSFSFSNYYTLSGDLPPKKVEPITLYKRIKFDPLTPEWFSKHVEKEL